MGLYLVTYEKRQATGFLTWPSQVVFAHSAWPGLIPSLSFANFKGEKKRPPIKKIRGRHTFS
ncbi:hypothetical protein X474_13355 [Dethiosulfatarculus sandiegensis]|uniref:Uncharacterized protein n=1 Tax=Dethiosulfatarculus sandiegensis TaxID=1429043 RepID=A0A0D2JCJ1_9BACT|nr:hypothetical protein X474_13355 [Dethiosulfatarculus sandiegensis]